MIYGVLSVNDALRYVICDCC